MQKRYRYIFRTCVEFRTAVCRHHFLLRCMPWECGMQHVISTKCEMSGVSWQRGGTDSFGNTLLYGSVMGFHPEFTVVSEGEIEQQPYILEEKPEPFYRYASPLTAASDGIRDFVRTVLGDMTELPPLQKARALADSLHGKIRYRRGVTTSDTAAAEAFAKGAGVCQDYSHILLSCCRTAGIPARYVCGLMQGEGATHAWAEIHDNGRWYGIDPTNNQMIETGYVKIAHGRDANDCPMNRGIYTGPTDELMTISVSVKEI